MKKRFGFIILISILIVINAIVWDYFYDKKNQKIVCITQIVEHPSLNLIRDSFLEKMNKLGYKDGNNVKYFIKSAQGDMNINASIIKEFESKNPNVIVPIATPGAIEAAKISDKIPIVFSAVSDPIGAKLTDNIHKPNKNITGTSDVIQVDKILELAMKLTPNIKKIALLYNSGEDNSISNIKKAKNYLEKNSIEYVDISISQVSEISQVIKSILPKVDAVFSPNDNMIADGINIITKEMERAKKPFYVGADSMVKDNGFATVGIDYKLLGEETANMVDKVLKGIKVYDIPILEFKENLKIYVNENVAKEIGIKIPTEIKESKDYIGIR